MFPDCCTISIDFESLLSSDDGRLGNVEKMKKKSSDGEKSNVGVKHPGNPSITDDNQIAKTKKSSTR